MKLASCKSAGRAAVCDCGTPWTFLLLLFFFTLLTAPRQWPRFGVSLTIYCLVVYSAKRFVLCFTLYYFFLVFFSPFSIAITSLGEEIANLSVFVRLFVLVWICRFPLPLGVWEGLRFVNVALPGLFSYFLYILIACRKKPTKLHRIRATPGPPP